MKSATSRLRCRFEALRVLKEREVRRCRRESFALRQRAGSLPTNRDCSRMCTARGSAGSLLPPPVVSSGSWSRSTDSREEICRWSVSARFGCQAIHQEDSLRLHRTQRILLCNYSGQATCANWRTPWSARSRWRTRSGSASTSLPPRSGRTVCVSVTGEIRTLADVEPDYIQGGH